MVFKHYFILNQYLTIFLGVINYFPRTLLTHRQLKALCTVLHPTLSKFKGPQMLGGGPKKTQSVILNNPNETEPKGNQEPITINQ